MKILSIGIILLISLCINSGSEQSKLSNHNNDVLRNSQVLCSTGNIAARCTGSIYCNACKNCKYCKYCNSGGSCGVCGKKSKNNSSTLKKKNKTTNTRNGNFSNKYPNNQDKSKSFSNQKGNIYVVTQKTSLRATGHSKAAVLKRLQVNDEVIVIDTSKEYWWVVRCNGDIGWVKKHLLKAKYNYP